MCSVADHGYLYACSRQRSWSPANVENEVELRCHKLPERTLANGFSLTLQSGTPSCCDTVQVGLHVFGDLATAAVRAKALLMLSVSNMHGDRLTRGTALKEWGPKFQVAAVV